MRCSIERCPPHHEEIAPGLSPLPSCCCSAQPLLSGLTARRIPEPLAVPLDQIDSTIEGWKAAGDRILPAPTLHALSPTAYLVRTYQKDTANLDLFIAYYAQQRAGESMHSPKHCLPGAGWEIWKHDSVSIPVHGNPVQINKYSIQNSGVENAHVLLVSIQDPHCGQRVSR